MSVKKSIKLIERWEALKENLLPFSLVILGAPIIIFILIFGMVPLALHSHILQKVDQNPLLENVIGYSELCLGVTNTLLSILTIVLLGITFFYTRKVNNKQLFESKFFDLLKIHRENAKEINFETIHETIYFLSEHLRTRYPTLADRKRLEISYLAVFWGIGNSSETLQRQLSKYHSDLKQKNDHIITTLRTLYHDIHSYDSAPSPFKGRLDGTQSTTGHYHRHLFQMVRFINRQSFLTFKERYDYVKTLRAQFGNYELAIFFFNSITAVGKNWELNQRKFYNRLITRYNLIKNMPAILVKGIDIKKIYPEVEYEND